MHFYSMKSKYGMFFNHYFAVKKSKIRYFHCRVLTNQKTGFLVENIKHTYTNIAVILQETRNILTFINKSTKDEYRNTLVTQCFLLFLDILPWAKPREIIPVTARINQPKSLVVEGYLVLVPRTRWRPVQSPVPSARLLPHWSIRSLPSTWHMIV